MKKKSVTVLLAAATLSAALIGGQVLPAYAGDSHTLETSLIIPDNVTIDEPTALGNIALPGSEYGSLAWADSSYVPSKRVQSCEVIFTPAAGTDLSEVSGWDSSSGTVTGYVTVVVSSIDSSVQDTENTAESNTYESDNTDNNENTAEVTETPEEETEEKETSDSETSAATEDDSKENSTQQEETPEVSAAPEENKEDSDISVTSAPSKEEAVTPEITEEAKNSGTGNTEPEVTVKPDSGNDEDGSVTEPENTPEADKKETVIPSDSEKITETPEVTEMPEETETPEKSETLITPEITSEPKVTDVAEPTVTPDIFERNSENEPDERPAVAEQNLTEEEKEAVAEQNHTCDGITVSGIDLPWYVQFRVTGGEDYTFTNEEDATIFKSYEFELWDTQNNTEYTIPDGEYISVTVPVKAGYSYSIEHILDSGAMETIIPSVDGNTMTFSTHSFSPFGIAGSKSLVGPDADGTEAAVTPSAGTPTPGSTTDSSIDSSETVTSAPSETTAVSSDSTADSETDSQSTENENAQDSSTKSAKNVETGDTTRILPFVILFLAAAAIAAVVVVVLKKKK